MKSIVTIGGGTGQFTLLSGLKKFPVRLTAIVSMADSGGSTGVLRDELGVLPPGDIRQCLTALAESDTIMRDLFNYRFENGGFKGHNFGNIFLSVLEKITGSFEEAVRVSGQVLATRGSVIPVTTDSITLLYGVDRALRGEHAIAEAEIPQKETLRLEPEAYANPRAVEAIEAADCIVIGPGNLYCSVIPNFLVKGIPEAIARSKAVVVYNCNLMTKKGHTDGFGVRDFLSEIERYIGHGRVDYVTHNDREADAELLARYAAEGEMPVSVPNNDEIFSGGARRISADLVSPKEPVVSSGDPLKRTLIRHNPDALASLIIENCLANL